MTAIENTAATGFAPIRQADTPTGPDSPRGTAAAQPSSDAHDGSERCPCPSDAEELGPTEAAGPKVIGIVVYDDFESLDVFGPVQMWGRLADHRIVLVSEDGRAVRSAQRVGVSVDHSFGDAPPFDMIMVPGGMGARRQVHNGALLSFLRMQDRQTRWTTSVCTGAAILARAGILDGRSATTNKLAFAWATGESVRVNWQPNARWVQDGKYVTSSGVSAGTDMALALVERLYDVQTARGTAKLAEYVWNEDALDDPFALPSEATE